ncbi:MAG: methyltransferase domain-containing protein [Gammaproteobacteria bacterium]|nr:methyltransferase domain-containing protein [Gammaproteobacteria bacterium]
MITENKEKNLKSVDVITSKYNLNVGERGEKRLKVLGGLYNNNSIEFIREMGVENCNMVLDVASGTGEMTCKISKLSLGRVIGIDNSPEQISVAKKNADNLNIESVEFINVSAEELSSLNIKFDLIYCRFLLVHLRDPMIALKSMYDSLAIGGKLICEEATSSISFCYPPSTVFDKWLKLWDAIRADYDIGLKLHDAFRKLNLKIEKSIVHQPILSNEEEKSILLYNVLESVAAAERVGFATPDEMAKFADDMREFCKEDRYFIGYLRNTLICGKK